MSLREDALDLLTHWPAPTADQELLREEYVAHLVAHPDGLDRSCVPDHVTASALVLSDDRSQALLQLHRKAGRWFQFGGHVEKTDSTLAGAALREASEESGIDGLLVEAEPLHLSVHAVPFCHPGAGVRHLDVRFLALAPVGAEPRANEESLDVRWWPVGALPTEDADMLEMLELARAR